MEVVICTRTGIYYCFIAEGWLWNISRAAVTPCPQKWRFLERRCIAKEKSVQVSSSI